MPVSSTGMCRAARRSRIAVRFVSVSAGSTPRSPSFAPSSTMAASAPSPSDQSSRASPPAEVSPDTAPSMMLHVVAVGMQRGCKLRLEALGAAAGRSRRTANRRAPAAGPAPRRRAAGSTRASAMMAFRHRPRTPYGAAMDATPPSPVPLVQVRNLHLTVPSAAGPVNILRGIDLDIAAGEAVGIVGPVRLRQDQPADGARRAWSAPAREPSCWPGRRSRRWMRTRWPACGARRSASCSRRST